MAVIRLQASEACLEDEVDDIFSPSDILFYVMKAQTVYVFPKTHVYVAVKGAGEVRLRIAEMFCDGRKGDWFAKVFLEIGK